MLGQAHRPPRKGAGPVTPGRSHEMGGWNPVAGSGRAALRAKGWSGSRVGRGGGAGARMRRRPEGGARAKDGPGVVVKQLCLSLAAPESP